MLKKILIVITSVLVILIAVAAICVVTAGPDFSAETEQVIQAVIDAPLVEQVGEQGYVMNGDTRIWYDVQDPIGTDSIKASVVLIMGLSADAMAWPNYFNDSLRKAGYQVIRLDNRGVGMSDWDDFDPEDPYSLTDMSKDVLAVLDTLGIEKAHICGVSLGGMIGQTMAIEFPERLLSLTSIMSTPDIMDPSLPKLRIGCFVKMGLCAVRYGLSETEMNAVKFGLASRAILMGSDKYEQDVERISQLTVYNVRNRNGLNKRSGQQQTSAVEISGSRVEALKKLTVPTLVVHGITDPLIPFEHGLKTAELIPNAETLWLDGLGHSIPEKYSQPIVLKMLELFKKVPM